MLPVEIFSLAQAGTIVGFFLSGLMVDAVGWENTFYIEVIKQEGASGSSIEAENSTRSIVPHALP